MITPIKHSFINFNHNFTNPLKTQSLLNQPCYDTVSFTAKAKEEPKGRFDDFEKALKDLKTEADELELIQEINDILTYEALGLDDEDIDSLLSAVVNRSLEQAENDAISAEYISLVGRVFCNYLLHNHNEIDKMLLNKKLYTGQKAQTELAQVQSEYLTV